MTFYIVESRPFTKQYTPKAIVSRFISCIARATSAMIPDAMRVAIMSWAAADRVQYAASLDPTPASMTFEGGIHNWSIGNSIYADVSGVDGKCFFGRGSTFPWPQTETPSA